MPLGSAFKRPYGMRRMLFDFPGTKVPGCVQSFLWNEGSDFCRGLLQGSADFSSFPNSIWERPLVIRKTPFCAILSP